MFTRRRLGTSFKTKTLVRAGFLTALSIVFTRFLSVMIPISGFPAIRVSFGSIPIVISGLFFGPAIGGLTGAAADLVGVLINPMGTYHPGFTLSSILDGVIPGLMAMSFRKRPKAGRYFSFRRILAVEFILSLINSTILNTLWLSQLYGTAYMVLLPARLLNAAAKLPIHTVIVFTVIRYLSRFIED